MLMHPPPATALMPSPPPLAPAPPATAETFSPGTTTPGSSTTPPTPDVLVPALAFLIAPFLSTKSLLQAASASKSCRTHFRKEVVRLRLHIPRAPVPLPAVMAAMAAAAPAPLLWHALQHHHHHHHHHHHQAQHPQPQLPQPMHEEAIEEQEFGAAAEEEEDSDDSDSESDDGDDSDEEEEEEGLLPLALPPLQLLSSTTTRALGVLGMFRQLEVLHLRNVPSAPFFTFFFQAVTRDGLCARLQSLTISSSPSALVPAPSSALAGGGALAAAAAVAAASNNSCAILGDAGWMAMVFCFRLGGLPCLKHLGLRNQGLGPRIVAHLAQSLVYPSRRGAGLETLVLSDNLLTNEGVAALASHALAKWGHGLRSLRVSNVGCGELGAVALAEAIRDATARGPSWALQTLDLGGNPGIGAGGGKALAEVVGVLPRLAHLDLNRTEMGVVGVQAWAEALLATPLGSLTYLGLGFCHMHDDGAAALCRALGAGACPALESLDLTMNALTSLTVQRLVQQKEALRGLVVLILSSNKINMRGAEFLLRGLQEGCPQLRHVNLWGNALPVRGGAGCLRGWEGMELYY